MAAASAQEIEPEVLTVFRQLREKIILAHRAKAKNDDAVIRLERGIAHKKLLLGEMSTLAPEAVTYKNVGKAYMLTPKEKVVKAYEDDYRDAEEEVQKRRKDKDVYAKQISSAEEELREHLNSNPRLANLVAAGSGQ